MGIEIAAVGGYNEVGRQCTAVRIDDEVYLLDMGLHLDHYIKYTEDDDEDLNTTNVRGLRQAGAIPDWTSIKDWKGMVKGILLTHAHLDHIGAVPYLASTFNVPIYGSAFTIEVLKQLIEDKDMEIEAELIIVKDEVKLSENVSAQFIHMTHSTVDCKLIALETKYGVVSIDNDYKLDHHPTFGKPPDFKRIGALSGRVIAHIGECLYAPHSTHTPSESVARIMLSDLLLEQDFRKRRVFVSTFSSHIARLITLMEIGQAMERQVVFLGRSMSKYLTAAENAGLLKMPKHARMLKYGSQVKKFLKSEADLTKYLVVCTGHMGEQKAALSKLVDGKYTFRFKADDVVVFSSSVIPVPSIIASRHELERKLKDKKVRFFADVHVSGHASREDIRYMLNLMKPKHVIPNHGNHQMTACYVELARECGIPPANIHNVHEGDRIRIV